MKTRAHVQGERQDRLVEMEARAKRREMAQLELFAGMWRMAVPRKSVLWAKALPSTELTRHPPTASRRGACTRCRVLERHS